jgi:RNA polymerase sigma-70 factor (ECF subfamily)
MLADYQSPDPSSLQDDRLRLIFTCCHPALVTDAQVALTLPLLGGLTAGEIAQGFLVPQATMAKRAHPGEAENQGRSDPLPRPGRCRAAHPAPWCTRHALPGLQRGLPSLKPGERHPGRSVRWAIRLARILASLMPDEPEVQGLVALMLLTDARRAARVTGGALVPLPDQDRTRWDAELITEGHAIVRACLRRNRPGPHQLLAAINAVHTDAATAAETDWTQILQLYDQLYAVTPTQSARSTGP